MNIDGYKITYLPIARRQLTALPDSVQNQIREEIHALSEDPLPPNSIPMRGKGHGLHRIRVGDYRVIYRVQNDRLVVLVIRIGPRENVYSGFED